MCVHRLPRTISYKHGGVLRQRHADGLRVGEAVKQPTSLLRCQLNQRRLPAHAIHTVQSSFLSLSFCQHSPFFSIRYSVPLPRLLFLSLRFCQHPLFCVSFYKTNGISATLCFSPCRHLLLSTAVYPPCAAVAGSVPARPCWAHPAGRRRRTRRWAAN